MAALQRLGGGAFGAAVTLGARRTLDQPGGTGLLRPSVIAGLGTGIAAGALYLVDLDVPVVSDSFLAAHAVTATPLGALSALFPRKQGTNLLGQISGGLLDSGGTGSGNGTAAGEGVSRRERAGTATVQQAPAGMNGRRNSGT